jgi:hypothetical protein
MIGTPIVSAGLGAITLALVALVTGVFAAPIGLVIGAVIGAVYGSIAGWAGAYDLGDSGQVGALIVDCTWSLANTAFGLLIGVPIYAIVGSLSQTATKHSTWLEFHAPPSASFGNSVLQTLGTVNLGGAGKHERVHLVQARVLGPLYLPLQAASYVLNTVLQGLWCATFGWILRATGKRQRVPLQAPADSAVSGGWGWIYRLTVLELWAYATE